MAAKFEIFKDKRGEFRLHLKAPNGRGHRQQRGLQDEGQRRQGLENGFEHQRFSHHQPLISICRKQIYSAVLMTLATVIVAARGGPGGWPQ